MTMPRGDKKTSKTSGITNNIIPSFKAGNQGLQQNKEINPIKKFKQKVLTFLDPVHQMISAKQKNIDWFHLS